MYAVLFFISAVTVCLERRYQGSISKGSIKTHSNVYFVTARTCLAKLRPADAQVPLFKPHVRVLYPKQMPNAPVQYRKVPGLLLFKCLGESRWEGKLRSHFRKPIVSVCHVTRRCEHALFLHECFFDFVFRFFCDRWQNRAICLRQVLREAR
jgi:hypothetical protein